LLARRIEESTKNLTRLYEDLKETYMRTIKALAQRSTRGSLYLFPFRQCDALRRGDCAADECDPAYINDIRDACQLHDLGKIGVHDNVLSKPSALTDDEFNQIKQHAEKGAQILEPLKFLDAVITIVKHHHERWDGKGYPTGSKAKRFPWARAL
jgi:putative nucleotidyltransferase with HDIG domain